jgi:hypothetical protein
MSPIASQYNFAIPTFISIKSHQYYFSLSIITHVHLSNFHSQLAVILLYGSYIYIYCLFIAHLYIFLAQLFIWTIYNPSIYFSLKNIYMAHQYIFHIQIFFKLILAHLYIFHQIIYLAHL